VGQVYDGPMDLLLDLIRKQDIDIYDIPIARITAQFLGYVEKLKSTDVDVAGEFIYMASLLIHIKSKMLLPRSPSGPEDTAEDPAANWSSGCWSTSASKTPRRCCSRSRCSKPLRGPTPA
jgi:chromatin segregation and condensation protein Rec8/ScpA/Scc1 (kleisin family)